MSNLNPQGPPVPGKEEQLYPPPAGAPPGHALGSQPHHNQLLQTENPAAPYELPAQHFPPPPPGPPPSQQPHAQPDLQAPLKEAGVLSQSGHAVPPGQKNPAVVEPYDPSAKIAPPLGEKPPLAPEDEEHPPPRPPRPAVAPHHANDVPIPDYDPSHPNYAPPPADQAAYGIPGEAEEHGRHQRGWLAGLGAKAAGPINALANKLGAQSFLPTTMEKECEKAAKILKSFCKEGISSETALPPPTTDTTGAAAEQPVTPTKEKAQRERGAIVKIPSKVIAKAKGLAIFTTARVGFQLSGATGSGILLARLPDGSWSPPSGIQVHAVGAGFMIGVDIYDCVCVINSRDALAAFMSTRVSLGPDVAVVAGPYGAGGVLDFGAGTGGSRKSGEHQRPVTPTTPVAGGPPTSGAAVPPTTEGDGKLRPDETADKKTHRRSASSSALKPVFSYVKSRGFYAGVQVDGTVITERKEANADFYGTSIPVERILRGEVPQGTAAHGWPAGAKLLYEALKVAEAPKPGEGTIVNPPMAPQGATTVPPPVAGLGQSQGLRHDQAPYQEGLRHDQGLHQPGHGQQVPGAANVPLHRHEEQKGGLPTFPPPPTEETSAGGAPPPYVDDGTAKPGVGDQKTTYQ